MTKQKDNKIMQVEQDDELRDFPIDVKRDILDIINLSYNLASEAIYVS